MTQITLKGTSMYINGNLPEIGSQAPDFRLIDNDLNEVSLASYRGKKKLLNIIPSLDTPVCIKSTKYFDSQIKNRQDVVVLAIAADLPFAQKRFCQVENAHIVKTLSLMNNQKFAKDYGVLIVDGLFKGLTARAIVVLNENNKVIYTELIKEMANEPNYEKALLELFKSN